MKIWLYWLLFINAAAIVVCCADKISAKNLSRRVPEKVLFIISIFGGSPFMYITMLVIRHKTKHKRFMIGLPLIICLQVIISLLLFFRFYGINYLI